MSRIFMLKPADGIEGVKEAIFCDKTYKIIYDINEDDKTIQILERNYK